jgi:hypothetical protein
MSGLFGMQGVSKLSSERQTPFEGILGKSIRDAADREGGRDIALEDYFHGVMTFHPLRDDVFLLRFSNVDHDGKAYGNLTTVQTLVDITMSNLRAKARVCTPVDHVEVYDHFYNANTMGDTEILYVPNNKFVRTVVVRYAI